MSGIILWPWLTYLALALALAWHLGLDLGSAVVHSLWQRLKRGTAYRHMSHHLHRWRLSSAASRLSCSWDRTLEAWYRLMLHVTFLTLLRALEVNIDLCHINSYRWLETQLQRKIDPVGIQKEHVKVMKCHLMGKPYIMLAFRYLECKYGPKRCTCMRCKKEKSGKVFQNQFCI